MQVEKESKIVGLAKKDAMNLARWRGEVTKIAANVGRSGHPRLRDKPGSKLG